MAKTNQHIVLRGNGWAVQGASQSWATRVTDTQREAIDVAHGITRNQESELIVHGQDGKINWRNSYSDDSFPPKG